MRKLLSIAALGLLATTALLTPAQAQSAWRLNGEEAQLQAKINAGIRTGALTRFEAANLQSKLNRINNMEARMQSNGFGLNGRERMRLNNDLRRLRADINQQLTDSDFRFNNRFHRHFF